MKRGEKKERIYILITVLTVVGLRYNIATVVKIKDQDSTNIIYNLFKKDQ